MLTIMQTKGYIQHTHNLYYGSFW